MSQITASLPDELVTSLNAVATRLRRPRDVVIKPALEAYLYDQEDILAAIEVLRDAADPVLEWEAVRHELLDFHQTDRS